MTAHPLKATTKQKQNKLAKMVTPITNAKPNDTQNNTTIPTITTHNAE